jgi:hypothetical protein
MDQVQVAETILKQLGGNRFIAMTGVKNLISSKNSLSFKIPRNLTRANRVEITLTPDDLYTVSFFFISMNSSGDIRKDDIKTFEGVYFDQLPEIFTEVTGILTSF